MKGKLKLLKKIQITPTIKEKMKEVCIWLLKEVISGVTVAAAVAIATLGANEYIQTTQEKRNLELLYLGLNRTYVESVYGIPVAEYAENESNTIRAFYKQRHSIISCSYAGDNVVAYFVIVNTDKKLYQIPYNFYISKPTYLTDFTYADFSESAGDFEASCPANNDDYAYYSERYGGGAAAKYNYYIIGNYKDYFDTSYIPLIANALSDGSQDSFYTTTEYDSVRKKATPNVFGMVNAMYIDSIYLIPDSVDLQTYNQPIFDNWR